MNYQKIAILSLLSLILSAGPMAALASVSIDTSEKNFAPAVTSWTKYGKAEVLDNQVARLARSGNIDASFSVDTDVSNSDDYAVFVSYTKAENPYPKLSNSTENISGLPYLYAYFFDKNGKIVEYFNQDSMSQHAEVGTAWQVTYGIAAIPNNSESMRLFLKQASRSGVTADGRAAWFYKPGLYFTDSWSEAQKIVDAYVNELSDVRNENGLGYNHANNGNVPNYSIGTVLKCPSEPQIYSVTSATAIKLFPDEQTFYSWGYSFADVKTIPCDRLDNYTVSGTWTFERADYLVKFRGQSAIYTLDNDKYLRLIPNEYTARQMYGSHWRAKIHEYPVNRMNDYSYGVPHKSLR